MVSIPRKAHSYMDENQKKGVLGTIAEIEVSNRRPGSVTKEINPQG